MLSVGPLGDNGKLQEYAEWRPDIQKPDLFMTDNLVGTPLERAIKTETWESEDRTRGSSYAALQAVATAALVWSLLPDHPPLAIRDLLVAAAKPIKGEALARALKIEDALALARQRLVEQTLKEGAASLQTLSALTGLEGRGLAAILEPMIKAGRVARLAIGRLERYQLLV